MAIDMTDYFQVIYDECIKYFDNSSEDDPVEMATQIMKIQNFPMHSPHHHFLVPAVLLTAAALNTGMEKQVFVDKLLLIQKRAKTVPGAICGEFGACGAGVGSGLFAAVWLETTPHSKELLKDVGAFTANALSSIASYPGPRCCKRVTYLALESGVRDYGKLGIEMNCKDVVCGFFPQNKDCIGKKCRYIPKSG